jgi:hypothetical protein
MKKKFLASGLWSPVSKGVTLVELIFAIGLMSVIVLAAGSFEIASKRFLNSSERRTTVVNELTYVMEHMRKYISHINGSLSDPANLTTPFNFFDCPASGTYLSSSMALHTDTGWVSYWTSPALGAGTGVKFCPDYNPANSSCNVTEEYLSHSVYGGAWLTANYYAFVCPNSGVKGQFTIYLNATYDPTLAPDPSTNPTAAMNITLVSPSLSLN